MPSFPQRRESSTLFFILFAGFRPCRRGPFVSAKGPKTISAHRGPSDSLRRQEEFGACATRSAQTVLGLFPNSSCQLGHADGGNPED